MQLQDTLEQTDNVVLVTPQDEEIGTLDKFVAHRHPAQLHRAISVWMIDEQRRLLLQKRSIKKIVGAEWWGNTVCGNVWPEESYEACAHRRLRVELGIEGVQLEPVTKFHYKAYANDQYAEHEMDQAFVSYVESAQVQPKPNPDEASEIAWVSTDEFLDQLEKELEAFRHQTGRNYPQVQQTITMNTDELRKWTPPLSVELAGQPRMIVPWTVLMAQLPEIQEVLKPAV